LKRARSGVSKAATADSASGGDAGNRRSEIVEAAAKLFAERGYKHTSVRDIGERVGLLSGSLYYHIRSKEELYLEVHSLAMTRSSGELRKAAAAFTDPWERLRAVCIRHVEMQVDPNALAAPLMADRPTLNSELRARLVAQRDAYEDVFRALIADLPLSASVDRSVTRLLLLTLLNNVRTWYRPGRLSPREIAEHIYLLFKGMEHRDGAVTRPA
jgi:AcrR family transcriptional regulator